MVGRLKNSQGVTRFMPQFLRWGEYGTVLAIIPGTLLTLLTGQFVFAASPITLSLWLNLFRRFYGDRCTSQILFDQDQSTVHRFESVLESSKRERADLLIEHAGELDQRDHPQLLQVITFRLGCIEENQNALRTYLEESQRTFSDEIYHLNAVQAQQKQHLDQSTARFERDRPLDLDQNHQRLQVLSDRIQRIRAILSPDETLWNQLCERLALLEQLVDQRLSQQGKESPPLELTLQEIWRSVEQPTLHRLEALVLKSQLVLSQGMKNGADMPRMKAELESMDQRLIEQINRWEELYREQGDRLQRLNERIAMLKQHLDANHQAQIERSTAIEQEVATYHSASLQIGALDDIPNINRIRTQLSDLQSQIEHQHQNNVLESALQEVITEAEKQLGQITEVLEHQNREGYADPNINQVHVLLPSLRRRVSEFDETLSQLSQGRSPEQINAEILEIESRLEELSDQVGAISHDRDRLAAFRDLNVQLSMIRTKVEELNTQVSMSLEQIPYWVEHHIRQTFSRSKALK